MRQRQYSEADRLIMQFDTALAGLFGRTHESPRLIHPAEDKAVSGLKGDDLRVSRGLMRVNHAGEVSAQALYQGQGLTARSLSVQTKMKRAAEEELDHLKWCRQRLDELETHSSYLNPLWYTGSFTIGVLAGIAGDKWSLGFVAETENQVESHLESHLKKLPPQDEKSRAIIEKMKEDEAHHARMAMESGGAILPAGIRKIMTLCSRVMTTTAYWI